MNANQLGWFLFAVGVMVIVALLTGDILTLVRSGGSVDQAFIYGMLAHVSVPVLAFKGGLMIVPKDAGVVSDAKRAELGKDVVGV